MTNYIQQANKLHCFLESKNTVSIEELQGLLLSGTVNQLFQEQNRVLLQCTDSEFTAYTCLLKFTQFLAKHKPTLLYKVKLKVNSQVDSHLRNSRRSCRISAISDVSNNGIEYHMDTVYFSLLNENEQITLASTLSMPV